MATIRPNELNVAIDEVWDNEILNRPYTASEYSLGVATMGDMVNIPINNRRYMDSLVNDSDIARAVELADFEQAQRLQAAQAYDFNSMRNAVDSMRNELGRIEEQSIGREIRQALDATGVTPSEFPKTKRVEIVYT